jgi:hypothetical protein
MMGDEMSDRPLIAYKVNRSAAEIAPGPRQREWMPPSAKVCLPLLIANQSGWELINPHTFTATWNGGDSRDAVVIDHPRGAHGGVGSQFGSGILTWMVDYLFRTPPGWNLLARGPVNRPKDGASPLEGVIETDWTDRTFTMNWKLTRPGLPVTFEAGEPFGMIVPQPRGELEAFAPRVASLEEDPDTAAGFAAASKSRRELQIRKFASEHVPALGGARAQWEGDYYRGVASDGEKVPQHQMRLKLRPFAQLDN